MNHLESVNLGLQYLSKGQVQEAEQLSSQLLKEAPDLAEAHYLACEVAIARIQPAWALDHINRAIEINSREPELRLRKAGIEIMCRQGIKAQETAAEVAARFPEDPNVQLSAARVFTDCSNHAGAEPYILKAGAKDPRNPRYLFEFSTNQFFLGKTDKADKAISDYLDLNLERNGRKLLLRAMLRKQTPENNNVEMLRNYLSWPLPDQEAVNCHFALAKELEDIGEYPDSFESLRSGAEIQRRLINYSAADEFENIKGIIETFQPESFAGIADSASQESPVFILGLPRTGTTLVERIVMRDEDVKSAEETNDFTLAFSSVINDFIATNPGRNLTPLTAALEVDYCEIADRYLGYMRGMLGPAKRYLDKTPFNFLYCGLIKKAFPRARIIHLVRDPMDTCYAIFKTLFNQAYWYSYDLEEMAEYYVRYRELMEHWHRLMPGAILDVRYEELVSNPHDVTRQIADYVGFRWSEELAQVQKNPAPSSTASAAQIRQPIYTSSIGLWRNYASELEPARRILEAAEIVNESGDPLS